MDEAARAEQAALLDIYRDALGMLSSTPQGDAASRREEQRVRESVRDVS